MAKLAKAMQKQLNVTETEKGAITFKTSESDLLDFFSQASSRRGQDITPYFSKAFAEDETLATVAAYYMRDPRGGQGERELFRQILSWLADNKPEVFGKVFAFVPEYARWDDLFHLAKHEKVGKTVTGFILGQLRQDIDAERPSLLPKWIVSSNTSSRESRRLASYFIDKLGWTEKQYRQTLSKLRAKLKVVERDMSANNWAEIKYSAVPSYAAKLYRKAFGRHDKDRYAQFLADVKTGKTKINASVLYPYDLVKNYLTNRWHQADNTIEAQWNALPNYADTEENALVIADLSGSMFSANYNNKSDLQPAHVAISLAIYIAERNKGLFKDYWMNFSETPNLIKLKGKTLYEKVNNLDRSNWGFTTNLQSAFELILDTAVKNNLPQSEMPTKLFCISDMQWDAATTGNKRTNFEAIQKKYRKAGYEMPTIVFWNVAARGEQSPVTKDENGVYLMSGCSPSIFKNAVNTEAVTPMELMLEVLNGERYKAIRAALTV